MTTFEEITYPNFGRAYRLANGLIELVITGEVGPRVIRLGFSGDVNEFAEMPPAAPGSSEWALYGGHRLWHAPEMKPRTYYPDNHPVTVAQHGDFVRVTQPTEPMTHIEKQMDFYLAADQAQVRVVHRMINHGAWPVELAIWALSVMATGGIAIIPLPERGSHAEKLLPASSLTMWPYTDMADPRWTWGKEFILLRQDVHAEHPQKAGYAVPDQWGAYARGGHLFVKTFDYQAGAPYPDMGCVVETFTNNAMLELETLSPLLTIEPGAAAEHIETWYLFRDVPQPNSEAEVKTAVLPLVKPLLG
jgi:hypothetical protein